jgi:hypothetical protein
MNRLAVGLGMVCALGACGGSQAPASPKRKQLVEWDGSRAFETANGQAALSGIVLRSSRSDEPTSIPSSSISERCWFLALGIPYLRPPFGDETVLGFVRAGGPFPASWKPEDRGAAKACADAFGDGFRLPTLTEAQYAFEMRVLTTLTSKSVLVRDDERGILTVVFEPKSVQGCRVYQPGCVAHVEFETLPDRWGQLHCVGPVSRLPAAEPSDAEIQQCVRRANAEVPRLDESKLERVVPEGELDLVLSMRRACRTQKGGDFDAILGRLRESAGDVPLNERLFETQRAHALATTGHKVASDATSPGEGVLATSDCALMRELYEKNCADESCLAAQARYATRCLGSDPSERLTRLAEELGARSRSLGESARRLELHGKVGENAARCAKDPAIARRFAWLLGVRPVASTEPPCSCPIDDIECGIRILLDPDSCRD